jgi:chaperonin cofactor prefoldin
LQLKEEVTERVEEVKDSYQSTICRLKREKEDFESRVNELNSVYSELSSKLGNLRQEEEQLQSRTDSRAYNTWQLLKSTREEADNLRDNLEFINSETRTTIKQIQSLETEIESLRKELNNEDEENSVPVGSKRRADEDPERDLSEVENIREADNEALEAIEVRQRKFSIFGFVSTQDFTFTCIILQFNWRIPAYVQRLAITKTL